jgi:predicted oxidoreductase
MKKINLGNSGLFASAIALGMMRISKLSLEEVEALVLKAVALGINFFDHADIYGGGKSESLFGEVLKRHPELRKQIIIQSKCGICKGYYDNSKEHILSSVDKSLTRLNCDYLDVLLIHRPDALMEAEEINEAFLELKKQGKVRYFGVSNMNSLQVEYLQRHLQEKIIINQLQFNVVHSGMIDSGINVNMKNSEATDLDGHILEYSRLNAITIQPWSVLQASWTEGTYIDNPLYPKLNEILDSLANKYQVDKAAIALAWILRHPANMQPIIGTTNITRLEKLIQASDINLTRQEWYQLYLASGHDLP